MDMSKYNTDIAAAEDTVAPDGPRIADGEYIMAVVEHEVKQKFEIPATNPIEYRQEGLWVTFRILEGDLAGKDYKEYYGLKHGTSAAHVRMGMSALKKFYTAINFMPQDFSGVYGKRFLGTLESKKQDNEDYPWSTSMVNYAVAPEPAGQTMTINADSVAQSFAGQVVQEPVQQAPVGTPLPGAVPTQLSAEGQDLMSKIQDVQQDMGFGQDKKWDGTGRAPSFTINPDKIPF